jgi:hypothetical protein
VRPTTGPISDLTGRAEARLARLSELSQPLHAPVQPQDGRLIAYVVIEAANLWAQYSRCFFLSCALGARDGSGQLTAQTRAATVDGALTLAVHAVKPKLRGTTRPWSRRDLPDFQNKGQLAKTLKYIQASVSPQVDVALAYQSRVLSDLPTARNFFAHKAEDAANKARGLAPRYGITRVSAPETLLCTVPSSGADILLREWLADLTAILGLMP